MRNMLLPALLLVCVQSLSGSAGDRHAISLDFGTFRPSYFYPEMNLGYESPGLFGTGLKIGTRILSYGTFYLVNFTSYDIAAYLEYHFPLLYENGGLSFHLSAGAGVEGRVRIVRYLPPGSVEPLVTAGFHLNWNSLGADVELWGRFYADGFSVTALPELSYQWDRVGVFVRSEIAYLQRTDVALRGFTWDNFLGVRFRF